MTMSREAFKEAWRKARIEAFLGTQSIGGLCFRMCARRDVPRHIQREEIVPRLTYWRLLDLARRTASSSDARFYLKRARAIRRGGFRDNWAGC